MNWLTTAQLIDDIKNPCGAVYYNTKTRSVNYTSSPLSSITGMNNFETRLFDLKTKTKKEKLGEYEKHGKEEIRKKNFTPKIKKNTRKQAST